MQFVRFYVHILFNTNTLAKIFINHLGDREFWSLDQHKGNLLCIPAVTQTDWWVTQLASSNMQETPVGLAK